MSVFISYNHKDNEFVDKLCLSLIKHNVKVWKDKWQINVGDSLINKIQDGLEGASYLCVVFSKNSLESEWVKREINAGLLREIEEKQIIILPIVIDNCKIPLLFRDKLYADFRNDFDSGLKQILAVVGRKYNVNHSGRISDGLDYYIDYLILQGIYNENFFLGIDIVSFDREEDFSILTQIKFYGNEYATKEYLELTSDESIKDYVLRACAEEFSRNPARVKIIGNEVVSGEFSIYDSSRKAIFEVKLKVERLGSISKNVVLFNVGALFTQICVDKGII